MPQSSCLSDPDAPLRNTCSIGQSIRRSPGWRSHVAWPERRASAKREMELYTVADGTWLNISHTRGPSGLWQASTNLTTVSSYAAERRQFYHPQQENWPPPSAEMLQRVNLQLSDGFIAVWKISKRKLLMSREEELLKQAKNNSSRDTALTLQIILGLRSWNNGFQRSGSSDFAVLIFRF